MSSGEIDTTERPRPGGPRPGRRIAVIGCSGSGKTTLSEALQRTLEYPSLELDALHHQKDWTPLDVTRFRAEVSEFIDRHDDWIVDGNYQTVADLIQSRCTDIIWLDMSLPRVLIRLFLRSLRRSVGRITLWNGNQERLRDLCSLDPERSMLVWAIKTHGRYMARFETMCHDPALSHAAFHRIKGPRNVERLIRMAHREFE